MKKILSTVLAALMILSIIPISALGFDASVTGNYFSVISEKKYALAPGASETELVLNNASGNDRKVVHYFEVDTKNKDIEVLPGYYGIDKLDPENLALNGVQDKAQFWKAEQLTKTVAYYEDLGYNVVGAMNTALAYDSNAPYGYMVWNGVVLGTPEVHKGAQTYLAIDGDGNCELRSMSTALKGNEVTAISANFGWLVKDGKLSKTTVERTSSDASRSMIGIKADGTLLFCQVDGRNAPISSGLSDYEMGEMMLALGCVNAVNCDGGGSSTFVSKREGETSNTMRSIPSDGSERATINSVILASKAKSTGEFDHAVLKTDYEYFAPYSTGVINVQGVDAAGGPAEVPTEDIGWTVDNAYGTIKDGVFVSNGTKGNAKITMTYKGENVGEKTISIVDPDVFAFSLDETVLPYSKSMTVEFASTYGADDWAVCMDGAYTLKLSDTSAATLNGNILTATSNEAFKGVDLTATYKADTSIEDVLKITFGKGSEIIYDFEDGTNAGFVGFDEAKQWCIDNNVNNTIVGSSPLAGQFNEQIVSTTFVTDKDNGGIARNGNHALAWSLDNTDATFANWSYNVIFNIGETKVLRDVENGKNATTLGMWLYIPEGAAGLAFQSQLYVKNADGTYSCKQDHFMFETVSGTRKNLNSCTEADIPESRWVYASIDISKYDYLCTPIASDASNTRSPSFIRTYIKPTAPAVHTFYIDDITLDYSSAVDDRVLPKIADISYTTADESVTLADKATISGNTVAFSATISDNQKLDYTSGKIYIDGNALENVSASGRYLASESVTLTSGVHTIVFEIKDTLGNTARVTRTFTIKGDEVFTLSGHNDSGLLPEIDSVYYVDIDTADIEAIDSLTASLKLQTANTWETDGITVADGFKVSSYSFNDTKDILTIKLERDGNPIDADIATLVSIPVRLWSWDGIDHVTNQPIAPEKQYATGYCPIVTVDCEVVKATVKFADTDYNGYLGAFGGEISVVTKINDTVNPWHYHDKDLTALNLEATCTTDGYTGRTYCEGCKSVIDWGTKVSASGHKYDENGECINCDDKTTMTGLYESDGNWYYFVNGKAVSGWQMIENDWYYFDVDTKIGVDGDVKVGGITYNFKDGKLTSGVWAKTLHGMRYYYGPGFYNDRGSWRNIDGKDYYFEKGVRLEGGYELVFENQKNRNWYYFNEDGSCDKSVKLADGFYTDRNGYAYSKNGEGLAGLQNIDGKYYYFDEKGYALKNGTYANHLFGDDYAAFTGLLEKNGTLYYYENGRTASYGLHEIDGDYYFVYWGGVVKTDGKFYVDTTNCGLPTGNYTFGKDGKMLDGVVEKDGNLYLYIDGKTATYGLFEVDGEYYYSYWGGVLKTDGRYFVDTTHCDLPAGNYTFGKDGKMFDGVVEKDGKLYLYQNGTTATCGLFEIDGEYYYSYWGGVLKTDGRYFVDTTFCDLPVGNYTFGKDGKMLDGVVDVNGTLYLYQNGKTATCGLFEIDGEYYYSYWGGVLKTDGRYFVDTTYCDLPVGNYTFGKDGKMLDGVVDVNGTLHLYQNGKTATCGLFEIDGEYYYSYWGGVLKTDGRYFVDTTYCDLPAGNYTFGKDGKMLDGVQNIDGKLYLYENGSTVTHGLYKIDGAYYFATWGGELKTDGRYFVDTTFCDLPAGNYTFGKDGKMYDGFVTIDSTIYYYENGSTPKPGLIEVDGDYYFVDWGGKIITNQKFYVWEGNGYTIEMNYTFDETGKVIG